MPRIGKAAALCGAAGPILFGVVLAGLSLLEHSFMSSLGWNPLTAPTHDWPSGLALGPLGPVMTATFIVSGLFLIFFALGMRSAFHSMPADRAASTLLALAGLAIAFLAFSTDPTNGGRATLHGRIHDAAFGVLGVALFGSMTVFGLAFLRHAKLQPHAALSWITAGLIVPSFIVKGIVFYFFLAAFIAWCEATAFRLRRAS